MSLFYPTQERADLKQSRLQLYSRSYQYGASRRSCQRSFRASTRRCWNHQRNYVRRSLKSWRHEESLHPYCHS